MIAIANVTRPRLVQGAVEALDFVGLGGAFAPGGGGAGLAGSAPFAGNPLTSDPARYARAVGVLSANPSIGLGGPTIGWIHAAFRWMARFEDPDFPRAIAVPTLVVTAGADLVTDTRACERFAERLRAGRLIVLDGSAHEILIERDVFRDSFWAAFDAFIPGAEREAAASGRAIAPPVDSPVK
jgi:lysophospholipase